MTDRQKLRANKKATRTLAYLGFCEKYLMSACETVSAESPEYAIIGNALGAVRNAKSDCEILVNRTKS